MTRLGIAIVVVMLAGCRSGPDEVVPYCSVDQVFAEPILRGFEQRSGVTVRGVFDTEETKSTGVVNRLIAESDHPQADVFWSGDPVRVSLLVRRGLVEPYVPADAGAVPARFRAADGTWTGVGARARVLLVNTTRVPRDAMPRSLDALVDPRWRGQVAIANPLFGTTTMHAAALFAVWGEPTAKAFFAALRANDVRVASSNGEVKRLVVAGEVAFGLVDSDDAAEAIAVGAAVETVYPDQHGIGTLVMPTTIVLLRNAPHPAAARRLIDGLVSKETEQQLASSGHMPLREDVTVAAGATRIGGLRAMAVDYAKVASEMERIQPWLREWVGL